MWNRPQTLNAIADLLYLLAGGMLLAMGLIWLMRVSFAPVQQVLVETPLVHVQARDIDEALDGVLRGNFLTLNLDVVRTELEKLPWVRRADVRRRWPSSIEVSLQEQIPAARWGEGRGELVNTFGEVFVAGLPEHEGKKLIVLQGPAGSAPDVIRVYQESQSVLEPLGLKAERVVLSQRLAWELKLVDGHHPDALLVLLGREQNMATVAQRLQRFAEVYPLVIERQSPRPRAVDFRYPNGFAMRLAAGQTVRP